MKEQIISKMKTIMKTKRTILTSVLLLLCILAFSQVQLVYETNNHLKFNDIQIDGDINAFSEKLVKQGFKITLRNETLSGLEGNLFGKECGVNVYGTEKTNTVYMVIVSFESEKIEWQALKKLYFD